MLSVSILTVAITFLLALITKVSSLIVPRDIDHFAHLQICDGSYLVPPHIYLYISLRGSPFAGHIALHNILPCALPFGML